MNKLEVSLKDLIKDNTVHFDSYRAGFFYYNIKDWFGEDEGEFDLYQFIIPEEDIGNATLLAKDKAIIFMRWIRKAIETNTLIKL